MTKEESLYQVKLILECLSKEEFEKVPKDMWEYINQNMKYNENIKIDPSIPLEEQDIDDKSYDYLEKVLKKIDENEKIEKEYQEKSKKYTGYTTVDFIKLIEKYEAENRNIPQMRKLVTDYKELIEEKESQIKKLNMINKDLVQNINACPKLVRKIFFSKLDENLLY